MTPGSEAQACEKPFTFVCDGSVLLGVIHEAASQCDLGMLTIVAGGPQYRGGCGRQLVELARRMALEGVPVMRFDHRGLGDSSGAFKGFQHIEKDILCAIEEFKKRVPSVKRIILWGGCDAASAALINAFKLPDVVGIIASNPWITTEETATLARKRHYRSRLLQKSFWLKLLRMEYNPFDYVSAALRRSRKQIVAEAGTRDDHAILYLERMLQGLNRFQGSVLFVLSGRSIFSSQFHELLCSDERWLRAVESERHQRVSIANADQTFSSRSGREELLNLASAWIEALK